MKSIKLLLSFCTVFFIALGVAEKASAQEEARAEAIQLYNSAQELAESNDFDGAIDLYRDALSVASENQLDDIVEEITNNLPRVYQSRASSAYSAYQESRDIPSLNNAMEAFQEAAEAGEEFGNDQIVQQATGAIPQLHYIRSVLNFRQENLDAALEDLDTAIEMNPNYAVAYYQKGMVLKRQNPEDIDGALEWFDQAIEIAEQTNNTEVANNARENAAEELIYRAATLKDERQYDRAIELLNRVENYAPQSANAQYRFAELYNTRGDWSTAENHARQALEYDTGGVTSKAKIYFELGMALKGQGEYEAACSAFEDARYGDFTQSANHELQFELKCEGHSASGR